MSNKPLFALLGILVVITMILSACSSSASSSAPATSAAPSSAATTAAPAASQPTASGKTYTIKAITFAPRNLFSASAIFTMVDKVKELSNGQLTIQYLGGPEVTPALQQPEAVRKGVVQMALVPVAYYDGMVPLGNIMELSEMSPDQERANGAFDYINSLHQKAGLYFVGRATYTATPNYHTIVLSKLIDKPQQLAGLKIGAGSSLLVPFLKKVGAAPIIVPVTDAYTNMERKVMDGYSVPITNHADIQIYEVAKYIIDHPFYEASGGMIMNLDSWNELPKNLQDVMTQASKFAIAKYMDEFAKQQVAARQKLIDNGMKTITFSDADAKWFYSTLYDSAWEEMTKNYPDQVAKLKPLLQKLVK